MKRLKLLLLGWLLLFPMVATCPARGAPAHPVAQKVQGTIVTWSHLTFALQPPRGKARTFLLARATRIYGKPVKGANAAVWFTTDKTGKRWARQVKVLRSVPSRRSGSKHRSRRHSP